MEEIVIPLKRPRGAIDIAWALFEQTDDSNFRAWIYMGKGKTIYAEMQTAAKGSHDIKSYFEFGEDPDVGPRYIDNGDITHRTPIDTLVDWEKWLWEYAAGLDPLDHFRFYREAVGGF